MKAPCNGGGATSGHHNRVFRRDAVLPRLPDLSRAEVIWRQVLQRVSRQRAHVTIILAPAPRAAREGEGSAENSLVFQGYLFDLTLA
jgi:hypothetical protein